MKKISHAFHFCFLSEVLCTNSKHSNLHKMSYRSITVYYLYQEPDPENLTQLWGRCTSDLWTGKGTKKEISDMFWSSLGVILSSLHLNSLPIPPPQARTYSRTRSARSYEFPFQRPTSPLPHHFSPEETRLPGHFLKTSWCDKKW